MKNEEAWENLYLDLVTCITMLRSLENTQHVKAQQDLQTNLTKANTQITKQSNFEEQRKGQIKNLQEKLVNLQK